MAEKEGSGIARSSQHSVQVVPHASHTIATFLGPALERVPPDAAGTHLLIITPDVDTALDVAEVARAISDRTTAPVVPLTNASRGARLLSGRAPQAVAATPSTLVAMLNQAALKLGEVRAVLVAWVDQMFTANEDEPLEIVLAEIPKDAARVVVAEQLTPQVEAFIERHLRRAHRLGGEPAAPFARVALRYVVSAPPARTTALRRVLDGLNPPSALIVAGSDRSERDVRETLRTLGYADDDPNMRVARGGDDLPGDASLVVLFDVPGAAGELARVAALGASNVVALVSPRQLPRLRRLTTGTVEPLDVSPTAARARGGDERVRAALRAELASSFPAREVMALEPLLADFDGLEIAAAALRLLERERAAAQARIEEAERAAAALPPVRAAEQGFTRVFMTIGERDGVRPGDLVGAIANEAGVSSDRIGKIDVRETHTVAEIDSSVVEQVIAKINGASVRGRRLTARVDERPARPTREGAREGGRGPRDRESRGGRGGAAGLREGGRGPRRDGPAARREGPPRRRERGDEPPRGRGGLRDRDDQGRVPRAAREREEWGERAERVRNARRPRRDEE